MKTVETFDYPLGNMILTIRITERCKSGTIYRTPEIIKVRMSDISCDQIERSESDNVMP